MRPAIEVRNLGKEYVLGAREKGNETFREMLMGSLAAPFRRLGRLQGDVAAEERFWALKDVSFDVQPGEVVGIIGRNGAGKSTLLKILSRITEPTTGEIGIRGRVASLLEVGTGFHTELTGRENIFLNGAILGMSRQEIGRKFDEIVDFAEVERFLDTPVKRYSSGMYVRLAFAVAAHLEPEILIVDEVLAVGDAQFQNKCMGRMKEVGQEGRTVLFVSHNIGAVNALCTKGMLLERGEVAAIGEVESVLANYMGGDQAQSSHYINRDSTATSSKASLQEVCLLGSAGLPVSQGFIDEACQLRIVWRLNERVPFLRVGIQVVDTSGVVVLSSMDTDISVELNEPREPGLYTERVELPPFLLMPGRYSVQVFAGMPHVERIMEADGVISFDVLDRNSHLSHVSGDKRAGYIPRPLNWSVEFESAS